MGRGIREGEIKEDLEDKDVYALEKRGKEEEKIHVGGVMKEDRRKWSGQGYWG